MRYGLRWYEGVGEHDYEECADFTYATLPELLSGLVREGRKRFPDDRIFAALDEGRQDAIHWITDDYGFEFYAVKN